MPFIDTIRRASLCLLAAGVASCGDHSGIADPIAAPPPNVIRLQSDAGDWVGGGRTYEYTRQNARLTVTATQGHLQVGISGHETWTADFVVPNGVTELRPGSYTGLTRYPFNDVAKGGMSWWGDGRGCNTLLGSFTIDSVSYDAGVLTAIDMRFEQHCEGAVPALRGTIHWRADDTSGPTGPVTPIPDTLWQVPAGWTPTGKNYVYLESDAGDYVGGGQHVTLTQADAVISVTANGGHLTIGATGWGGEFQAITSMTALRAGYYGEPQGYNPVTGGFAWSGSGRGCSSVVGWFAIDSLTYSGTTLTAIDLRFEQHCDGAAPALHGKIHWRNDDPTVPPGPVLPVPATLWKPAANATPTGMNYVYLQSDAGDYVGGGKTYTFTQANAILSVAANGGGLSVGAGGWAGNFQAMNVVTQLQAGYYGDLTRYPFHNPVKGGLNWSGDGRGCNTLTGWFAVDSLTYVNGKLTTIDLRFEQHCEGVAAALHGAIHWRNDDPTVPPGPVLPVPATLWKPAANATPTGMNYVYLQSDAGDYIGGGQTNTYTQANAMLSVAASGGKLTVGVGGWNGTFQAMNVVTQLQAGYYGNLTRYPFHNPVVGGLDWSGNGRGCNTLTGWFAVDSLTYVNGKLTTIDLRFEQHCEGVAAALHGAIHWRSDDTTAPPGPVLPIPTGLWQPPAGATPATGNSVYLQSDIGDYIGQGQTYTYVAPTTAVTVTANGGHLAVAVGGWTGDFQTMNVITQLQPGYYGDLTRYPFHNPVKGGLSWSGQARGCNTLTGWFAVDRVTYTNGVLTAIDLRFEQHCEGMTAALHGVVHWGA